MEYLVTLIPFLLILVLFYFLLIRPQKKQEEKIKQMRDSIKEGDEVVTIGGFTGIVYSYDDNNVVLELIPDGVKALVLKKAIARIVTEEESMFSGNDTLEDTDSEDDIDVVDVSTTEEIPSDDEVVEIKTSDDQKNE